jgi:DNA-binding GntR family transcriptional regulator
MRAALFPSVPQRGAESIAEHRQLLQLLEKRASPEVVERAMREHRLRSLEAALQQFAQWARTRNRAGVSETSVA